jgi:hypothetical protein
MKRIVVEFLDSDCDLTNVAGLVLAIEFGAPISCLSFHLRADYFGRLLRFRMREAGTIEAMFAVHMAVNAVLTHDNRAKLRKGPFSDDVRASFF